MNIRDIRKELCLSQAEFARLLGVHQTAVSQWETGRTSPEVEIAKRIARASGHSLSEVLNVESAPVANDEGLICVSMNDDGLRGERIRKGDTVYLRPQAEYAPCDIVGAETPEGIVVRMIVPVGGRRYLFADTPRDGQIEVTDQVRIIGKAVGFYSEL